MTLIQRAGNFLLRNPWQAGLVALIFSAAPLFNLPFVAWVSMVIVGFVSLRKGLQEGVIVLLGSAMVPLVFGFYDGNYVLLIGQVLLGSLLVYILALVLRKTASWQKILELSMWVGVACVLIAHWVSGDLHGFWLQELQKFFREVQQTAEIDLNQTMPPEVLLWFSRVMTGFITVGVLTTAVINLGLARWWQSVLFNPGGLRRELLAIRLSPFVSMAFFVCILLASLGFTIFWDLIPVFLICLFAGGLSLVLEYLFKQGFKRKAIGLLALCVFLIALPLYTVIIVSVFATADSVLNMRKRLSKPKRVE